MAKMSAPIPAPTVPAPSVSHLADPAPPTSASLRANVNCQN